MKTYTMVCWEDQNREAEVLRRPDGVYIQAGLSDYQCRLAVEWGVPIQHSRKAGFKLGLERPLEGMLWKGFL